MNKKKSSAGKHLVQAKREHRRWLTLVVMLSILVSVGTFYGLRKDAVAKTYQKRVLACQQIPGTVSHIHNDDCYYNGELVCPLQEIPPHRHTSECWQEEPVLVCGLEENDGHWHSDDCFAPVMELACGMEESAGDETHPAHQHSPACYRPMMALVCGLEEIPGDETHVGHRHTDACFEEVRELACGMEEGEGAHYHTDACWSMQNTLICGQAELPEHVHGPECFITEEMTPEELAARHSTPEPEETATGTDETNDTSDNAGGFVFLFPEEENETVGGTVTEEETAGTEESDPTVDVPEETPAAEPEPPRATRQLGSEMGGATVLAEVPEGILNEYARLSLADYSADHAKSVILSVVNANAAEGEERDISAIYVLDIGFTAGGEPSFPNGEAPIRITLRANEIRSMTAPKLFHLNNGTAEQLTDAVFDIDAGAVTFSAYGFSPFAVVDLTGEDPIPEVEKTVSVSMPAMHFEAEAEGVIVTVDAPKGAFPEGTTMIVSQVEMDDDTFSNVTDAVESSGEQKVVTAQAIDISFFDADQNLIEPKLPIRVSMKSAIVSESENVALVHLAEAEPVENAAPETPAATTAEVVTNVQVVENPNEHNEIQFESDAFSVYVLVGTETITANYITAGGETYAITVTYGEDAMIPDGAVLEVREIPADSAEYENYRNMSEHGLDSDLRITFARFFDITILKDGEEIQPQAPVEVKVEKLEELKDETTDEVKAVHFESGNSFRMIDTTSTEEAVSFTADGFSVYGIVGTETISTQFITADGETYTITVTYGPEAGIPKDAKLTVTEITEDYSEGDISYEEYIARTENALGMEEGTTEYIRLFDIKIVDVNDEKVVITAPVDVEIKLIDDDFDEMDKNSTQVVHFEDGSETGECLEDLDIVEDGIVFQAEGFSVYSIVSSGATTNQALNGNKFAIINTYNHTAVQGTNLAGSNNTRLSEIRVALSDDNKVRTLSDVAISTWTFSRDGNNGRNYYIQNEAGQYLNINNGYVRVSNTPQSIRVNTANDRAGLVRLVANDFAVNDYNNGVIADGFGPWNDNSDNEWFRLYALDRIDDDSITIHYVDETGNEIAPSKLISETTKAEGTSNYTETYVYGDVYDLYQPIDGYAYRSTHLGTYTGTQINAEVVLNTADSYNYNNNTPTVEDALIRTADYRWGYQEPKTGTLNYPTEYDLTPFEDGSHVYVVYTEGNETIPSHGSEGGGSDEELDEPKPVKNVTANGDGTYNMSLSVNASSKPISKTHGANVIVVFDMSASMDGGIGGNQTRLSAAREAARNVATRLLSLNDGRTEPLVEMMVIPFNSTTHNESGWYTVAGADNSTDQNTFNGYINRGMGSTAAGTNWERAIKRAKEVADGHQDGDDTYIIFLTDGNPWVGDSYGGMPHTHDATGSNYMQMGAYFYTTEPARQIIKSDYELYGVGMYGNVDVLHYLMNFAYTGRSTYDPTGNAYGHYFPAQQQELLVQALSDIAGSIEGKLAMAGVELKDGIALDTTHTSLTVSGQVNGITYSKTAGTAEGSTAFTVTVGTDGIPMFSINGGTAQVGQIVPKIYTKINEDGTTTSASADIYQLTAGSNVYEMAIASLNDTGDLDWDLSPLETLENGSTYTISTTVWPDQEAYDLVTDLNNGTATWDDSAATPVEKEGVVVFWQGGASKNGKTYDHIVKYPNGTYAAMSNRYQTLDYFVVNTEGESTTYTPGPTISMDFPDPMGLVNNQITLKKEWEKSMMPGATLPDSVTLSLLRDGTDFIEIELTGPDYETSKYIAPGLMINKASADAKGLTKEENVVSYNGGTNNYVILNTGHDYQFTEDFQQQFQLEEKVYHPMLVDNVLTDVKIEGKTVTPTDNDISQGLVATNQLKGGINIDKIVKDSNNNVIQSDQVFDVAVTLTVPTGDYGKPDFSDVDKFVVDGEVVNSSVAWYAYYDSDGNRQYDPALIEAGILTDSGQVDRTYGSKIGYGENHPLDQYYNYGSGWFMVDIDDTTGTVVGNVKVSDKYTLRFTNMAEGISYSAIETVPDGYEVSYLYEHVAFIDGQPQTPTTDGATHVVAVNQANNITITNKQTKSDLIIIKADDKGNAITSENDTALFKLVRNTVNDGSGSWVNAVDSGNDPSLIVVGTVTIKSTDGVSLNGLEDGLYRLTETKSPNGYVILTSSVYFKLTGGSVTFVEITETVDPDDETKKSYMVTDIDPPNGYTITAKSADVPTKITVANTPGVGLPNTGGSGTLPYILGGIALIMASALMYGFRMRRRERRLSF